VIGRKSPTAEVTVVKGGAEQVARIDRVNKEQVTKLAKGGLRRRMGLGVKVRKGERGRGRLTPSSGKGTPRVLIRCQENKPVPWEADLNTEKSSWPGKGRVEIGLCYIREEEEMAEKSSGLHVYRLGKCGKTGGRQRRYRRPWEGVRVKSPITKMEGKEILRGRGRVERP